MTMEKTRERPEARSAAIYVYSACPDLGPLYEQVRICRDLRQRLGLEVAGIYCHSGKHRDERDWMHEDAGRSMFTTVIVQSIDRLRGTSALYGSARGRRHSGDVDL